MGSNISKDIKVSKNGDEYYTTKNRDGEPVTYTKYSFKEEREDKKDEH